MRVISYSPPLVGRIGAVLWCSGVSAALVVVNTQDYASGRASAVVFVPVAAMVTLLMTCAYRIARMSFRADASGLVIRNFLSTRRVPLAQITGFDVGARFLLSIYFVRVITPAKAFPIGVYLRRTTLFLDGICDIADDLEDWLEAARTSAFMAE
jgi:hypothetical protein